VPLPGRVCRRTMHYPDLAGFLPAQRAAMPVADHLAGKAKWTGRGWRYELELTVFDPPPGSDPARDLAPADVEVEWPSFPELAARMDEGERLLRALGEWQASHPWTNHFVPAGASERVIGQILAGLTIDDIGEHGTVLTYPLPRSVLRTPGMTLPPEPVSHLFALLRTAAPDHRLAPMLDSNRTVHRLVTAAGGTEYLPAVHTPPDRQTPSVG
jgi:cytokinin dehydrogenase